MKARTRQAAGFWLLFPVTLGLNLPVGTVWAPLARAVGSG